MFRFIFKLVALVLILAVVYGFWLLYQDQPPEARQDIRERISNAFRDGVRLLAEAVSRTFSRIVSLVRGEEPAVVE